MAKDMPVSKQLPCYACRCLLASVPSNLDHCVAGWGKVYKKDGLLCDSVLVQWQGQYLRPSGKSQMYEVNAYSQIRTNATRDGERGGQHVRAWQIAREGTKDQDADTYATGRGRNGPRCCANPGIRYPASPLYCGWCFGSHAQGYNLSMVVGPASRRAKCVQLRPINTCMK